MTEDKPEEESGSRKKCPKEQKVQKDCDRCREKNETDLQGKKQRGCQNKERSQDVQISFSDAAAVAQRTSLSKPFTRLKSDPLQRLHLTFKLVCLQFLRVEIPAGSNSHSSD